MNLKPGMNILSSSTTFNANSEPHISGMGGASEHIDCVQKRPFYASLRRLIIRDRRLAVGSNVGSVK